MFEATTFTAFSMGLTALIAALFGGLSHSRCTRVSCGWKGCEVEREVMPPSSSSSSSESPPLNVVER